MTGLHPVRKRLKGCTRWYIYAWRGGPRVAVQDGERPVITAALIAQAEDLRGRVREPSAGTVRWLIELYRASPQFTNKAKSTRTDYNRSLDCIEAEFGDHEIEVFADIRIRRDIDDWRNRWAAQPRTADKRLVMLCTLLNWARREKGLIAVNHAEGMGLLHSADKADEVWEDRHWQALADAPEHIARVLKLASMTGLRLGDVLRLEWGTHIKAKHIDIITGKRKKRAVIPIFGELAAFLDTIRRDEGYVLLNSRGKPWTVSGFETVFQRNKGEGFDRRIHDLRGTYVTWLAVKGLTDEQIAKIIGWSLSRIAEIRARYVDEARVVVSIVEMLERKAG